MEQCPRCLKFFKDIAWHKKCSAFKSVDSSRDNYSEDENRVPIPEKDTYEARLKLGFAMMSDNYID